MDQYGITCHGRDRSTHPVELEVLFDPEPRQDSSDPFSAPCISYMDVVVRLDWDIRIVTWYMDQPLFHIDTARLTFWL